MIGHLGSRVSALLDGQLDPEETERAWTHVHGCHQCRDLVEREGWVKTRLAGLSLGETSGASDRLKGSLLEGSRLGTPASGLAVTPGDAFLLHDDLSARRRRATGLVALGGGAVGAAVMGVLVFAVVPGDSPSLDRRGPTTQLVGPTRPATTGTPTVSSRGSSEHAHARSRAASQAPRAVSHAGAAATPRPGPGTTAYTSGAGRPAR